MNDIAQERFIASLSKSLAENNIECKITGINEITLDLSEHDKQIKTEVIDEFVKNCEDIDNCYVSIAQVKNIAEKLKQQ